MFHSASNLASCTSSSSSSSSPIESKNQRGVTWRERIGLSRPKATYRKKHRIFGNQSLAIDIFQFLTKAEENTDSKALVSILSLIVSTNSAAWQFAITQQGWEIISCTSDGKRRWWRPPLSCGTTTPWFPFSQCASFSWIVFCGMKVTMLTRMLQCKDPCQCSNPTIQSALTRLWRTASEKSQVDSDSCGATKRTHPSFYARHKSVAATYKQTNKHTSKQKVGTTNDKEHSACLLASLGTERSTNSSEYRFSL